MAVTLSWRDSEEGVGAGNGVVVMVQKGEEKPENMLNS